jgi:diguanylate cyclase (GGDEF)-like protein
VSAAFQDLCRKYDYVARMGGDEFVFVFSSMPPKTAEARLAKLAGVVNEIGREVCGEQALSASFGTAGYPVDGAVPEELLAEADRRMYQSKRWRKVTAHNIGEFQHLRALSQAVH